MPANAGLSSSQAFDLLHAEIETGLAELQAKINEATRRGAFEQVGQLAKTAQELSDLKKDLAAVEKRFNRLIEAGDEDTTAEGKRLRKGLKTPQATYHLPILQALVELGGRSDLHPVLDRVYELVKDRLNEHDLAPLADDITPRWRNTAQWARNTLREEGLLCNDTPRSVWEISDKGRQWLAGQQKAIKK